ncbi:metal-sensitive transcriptional regulator [Acetobacter sp. AN02]|uniref:metal-sensitive transcriptional regulator n=1 Tax=Acetobacter sp. AN02 TaxID=2894186 RepID=UPI0024341BFF|nr:metal-sensitive transcriptional regulator [Acetobacter sp. AN02]MDG6093676.1 metal-sensitive transcriptional regulator [Acetobacter sp. AN02]
MPSDKTEGCSSCVPEDGSGTKTVTQPDKTALLNRLKRLEGQISGIRSMVEKDRYCVDILTQISAARAALDAVSVRLLSDHAKGCVRRAVMQDGGAAELDELLGVIRKMIR